MAQLVVTKILDGPRNAVFHIFIRGDGGGDLVDEIIIDPSSSFETPLPAVPCLKISKLWYDLTGFDAWLEFDYMFSDTPIWTLNSNGAATLDFEWFGGLTDRSNELDGSGQLKLSTNGLAVGSIGTAVILIRKS